MKMLSKALGIISLLSFVFTTLSGCGSAGAHIISTVQNPTTYEVPDAASVCVPVPDDLPFGDKPNKGSGERISERLAKAVEYSGRNPVIRPSRGECEAEDYALSAKLLHYENRYVGISSNEDRISVRVTLISLQTDSELNGFFITTRSNFNSLVWQVVDSKPESLLEKDFDEVVRSLLDGQPIS